MSVQGGLGRSADAACERIHGTSVRLLEDPGVRVEHDSVCALLLDAGARSGVDSQVIRFPEGLVRDALARAPSTVFLADRCGGGHTIAPETEEAVLWSTPGMKWHRRGEVRPFTCDDLAAYARFLDRLPRVSGIFAMRFSNRDFCGAGNAKCGRPMEGGTWLLGPKPSWMS